MKTKTIKVYQYSELNDKAKENAAQWFLECNDMQFQWECMQEDAKTVGIELQGTHHDTMQGSLLLDFTQVLANILKEHGETCETWKTARKYKDEYEKLTEEEIINGKDEDIREEFLQSILEDYRILWNKEEEYCQSEEYIEEIMSINEYEFDENGRRI